MDTKPFTDSLKPTFPSLPYPYLPLCKENPLAG